MKIVIAILAFLISTIVANAQTIIEQYTPQTEKLQIGPAKTKVLPYNEKGYTLISPGNNIAGILISIEDHKFDLNDSSQ
jgi:hypothetical protein